MDAEICCAWWGFLFGHESYWYQHNTKKGYSIEYWQATTLRSCVLCYVRSIFPLASTDWPGSTVASPAQLVPYRARCEHCCAFHRVLEGHAIRGITTRLVDAIRLQAKQSITVRLVLTQISRARLAGGASEPEENVEDRTGLFEILQIVHLLNCHTSYHEASSIQTWTLAMSCPWSSKSNLQRTRSFISTMIASDTGLHKKGDRRGQENGQASRKQEHTHMDGLSSW